MRYRKKPILIEAIQWNGDNYQEIAYKFPESFGSIVVKNSDELTIRTLEGTMVAGIGDWIIKDVEGQYYPCKDNIFKSTYSEEIQSDLDQDNLQHLYQDERQLKIKVQSYPFNVRTHLTIETNFGEIRFVYDIPPSYEERVGDIIHRTYNSLINELYETHEKKGGKFPGDDGCKDWMDKNGMTLLIKEPLLSKR